MGMPHGLWNGKFFELIKGLHEAVLQALWGEGDTAERAGFRQRRKRVNTARADDAATGEMPQWGISIDILWTRGA